MKVEVRGRGSKWRVFYPDESGLATQHLVYGKDGVAVRTIEAGAPTGKMTESTGGPFTTSAEAEEYARFLGADEVTVTRTSTTSESLAKARQARRKEAVPA